MFQQMTYIDAYVNFISVTCSPHNAKITISRYQPTNKSADTDYQPIIGASVLCTLDCVKLVPSGLNIMLTCICLVYAVRDGDTVKHYRIRQLDEGGFFIARRVTFRTLAEVVEQYGRDPDGLCVNLKKPCSLVSKYCRQNTLILSEDFRFVASIIIIIKYIRMLMLAVKSVSYTHLTLPTILRV